MNTPMSVAKRDRAKMKIVYYPKGSGVIPHINLKTLKGLVTCGDAFFAICSMKNKFHIFLFSTCPKIIQSLKYKRKGTDQNRSLKGRFIPQKKCTVILFNHDSATRSWI